MNLKALAVNQTQIGIGDIEILFSYNTPVAAWDYSTDKGYKTEKFWSATTSRHINAWLNGETVEVKPQSFFDNLASEVR